MPPEHLSPGVFLEEAGGPGPAIQPAPTAETAFVGEFAQGPENDPVRVRSLLEFEKQFGAAAGTSGLAVRQFFENGGAVAWIVRASQIDRATDALDGVKTLGLLATPDAPALPASAFSRFARAAMAYCQKRRVFYLLDIPEPVADASRASRFFDEFDIPRLDSAAVYFPRLIANGHNLPASGAIAGLIARTDAARGVWKAPAGAGADLRGVDVAAVLGERELELLNPLAINAIRRLPDGRVVCWGARTLAGDGASDYKYVPVRRYAYFLENSIRQSTQWVVFEPNDEPLWSRLRASVGDFLFRSFRDGALSANRPQDAFFVRCGRDTTTQSDIDQGIVNLEVGFAPLRPAEFVVLRLGLLTQRDMP